MKSSASIREDIAALNERIAIDEKALQGFQVLRAMGPLAPEEARQLSNLRAAISEVKQEREDLKGALAHATEFEKSEAGRAAMEAVTDALRRVEALTELARLAASDEDKALEELEVVTHRRVFWQLRLRDETSAAIHLMPAGDARERLRESLSFSPSSGGAAEAIAWRLMRIFRGADMEHVVEIGRGLTFDSKAQLSVEAAVRGAGAALLRRLDEAMTKAGCVVPERGDPKTVAYIWEMLGGKPVEEPA